MCARWAERISPDPVIAEIDRIRFVKKDGSIAFRGFSYFELKSLLCACVELDKTIVPEDKRRIVGRAVGVVDKARPLSAKTLLREIAKREREFLALPARHRAFVSSVSIRYAAALSPRVVHGARITFCRQLPKRFDRSWAEDTAGEEIVGELPKTYSAVIVTVLGRSEHEVVFRAMQQLDLLRSIWNLALNCGKRMGWCSGRPEPVNDILIGPIHTLHLSNGRPVSDLSWYEPGYLKAVKPFDDESRWERLQKEEDYVRRRLRNNKQRPFVEDMLRRYGRALDQWDFENAFLQLWGILESLTGTIGTSYDATVRRGSFLMARKEYHAQLLGLLRKSRNDVVHHARSLEDSVCMVYQLKVYVEALLLFLLKNANQFSCLDEFYQFLDSPRKKSTLDRRRRLLMIAGKHVRSLSSDANVNKNQKSN